MQPLQGVSRVSETKVSSWFLYFSSTKSWMNSEIMLDVLPKANRQLVWQNRKVIFMHNVTSHPPELAEKFSNIKVIFLPKHCLAPSATGCGKHKEILKWSIKHSISNKYLLRLIAIHSYGIWSNQVNKCSPCNWMGQTSLVRGKSWNSCELHQAL